MSPVSTASNRPTRRPEGRHPSIRWLAWSCAYVALAIAASWPVARLLTSHVAHDLGDPLLSLTLLQWNALAPLFTSQWWNGIGFYPVPDTVTLSDPRLGASLISTPLIWATGSPVAGYNVVFVLSFACSALAAHALVWRLTGSDRAGLVAGCAFGFAPFRTAHLAHLELLLAWWMPLALLAMHCWLDTRKRRWLALLATAVAAQGLFATYYLPMLGVLLALWTLWFAAARVPARQLAELGAAGLLGAAVLAPLFLHYSRAHDAMGVYRDIGEVQRYSADVSSIWSAAPDVRLWPSFGQENAERYLFPGVTVALLVFWSGYTRRAVTPPGPRLRLARRALVAVALAALAAALVSIVHGPWRVQVAGVRLLVSHFLKPVSVALAALVGAGLLTDRVRAAARTRSIFAFYLLAACTMFLLALGPNPTMLGVPVVYKAPYSWLMNVPPFEHSLRAPARFGMVVALALAVSAGLAWHHLTRHLPSRRVRRLTAVVSAAILAEGWAAPLTVVAPPPTIDWPSRCAGLPRLELPMGNPYTDAAAQYRAVIDGTRAVNGLSGFMPAPTLALIVALRARDEDAVAAIAERGPFCVSVDSAQESAAETVRWLSAHALAEPLGSNSRHVFRFIRRAVPAVVPAVLAPLPIAATDSHAGPANLAMLNDGEPATLWSTTEGQRPGQYLRLTLGCTATVASVALLQGGGRFARRLAIDLAGAGTPWRQVWEGTTGGLVVRSALHDPQQPWIEIPISAGGVRDIQLRILAADVPRDWAVAELLVRGKCEPQSVVPTPGVPR